MKLPSATLTRIYDLAMKSAGGLYTPHGDLSDVKRVDEWTRWCRKKSLHLFAY